MINLKKRQRQSGHKYLLGNIIDPYYTIWTIGVIFSSPVRPTLLCYQCCIIGCILSCWILYTKFTGSIPELFLLIYFIVLGRQIN